MYMGAFSRNSLAVLPYNTINVRDKTMHTLTIKGTFSIVCTSCMLISYELDSVGVLWFIVHIGTLFLLVFHFLATIISLRPFPFKLNTPMIILCRSGNRLIFTAKCIAVRCTGNQNRWDCMPNKDTKIYYTEVRPYSHFLPYIHFLRLSVWLSFPLFRVIWRACVLLRNPSATDCNAGRLARVNVVEPTKFSFRLSTYLL